MVKELRHTEATGVAHIWSFTQHYGIVVHFTTDFPQRMGSWFCVTVPILHSYR